METRLKCSFDIFIKLAVNNLPNPQAVLLNEPTITLFRTFWAVVCQSCLRGC